ncbi:D-alanyl-D-alanine carboxypeptidase/D-alanyl-D-alanine endopeptidase [Bifidobacterium moukalabense]|uniref:D-alanyl-D-alanine carboxypeptidase/D-alanyl-D-alanine endopeptidase n=1 Tax=Bifidobacterium moukalabense TaxID=1333651 RepID=UPI0010F8467A|nr:D-alanyl-D-alanine carboxypeptidase/D-alanyl-D-alanine-endopeptidase [Bifidobacterium moukalabense]
MTRRTGTFHHGTIRRRITVSLSVILTAALCLGYAACDLYDVLPGVLTLKEVERTTITNPRTVLSASKAIKRLDSSIAVDATAAQRLIDEFAATEGIGGDYSIAIADAKGEVVAESGIDKARVPASTMKTLTAYAAATTLDMGSTLATEVYMEQKQDGTANLVLVGNGDMLLGAGNSYTAHVNGRAGLGTLASDTARALKQRGISKVTLSYDDSLFGDDRWPSGIADLDTEHLYYAPVSSMAVDGGRQWNGANPRNPDVFSDYPVLSMQPALDAAQTFRQRLEEQGITVQGDAEQGGAPAGTSPIAKVQSASLSEVMAFMLRHSDNTLAEEFGRLLAISEKTDNSPAGATRAVKKVLEQAGISTNGLRMMNCSGLAEESKVTVRTLLEVQQRNLTAGAGAAAAEGLSIVGFVGTAADRLDDASEAGLLRVKTGSLGDVTSMAGNVSRTRGGALTFAVIINDPNDMQSAREAINTFIAGLPKL